QPDPPLRVSLPPTSPSGLHLPSPISDLRPLTSDFRPPYLANSLVTTDKSELPDLIGTTNKSELPDLIGTTDKSELPDETVAGYRLPVGRSSSPGPELRPVSPARSASSRLAATNFALWPPSPISHLRPPPSGLRLPTSIPGQFPCHNR